MQIIFLFLSTTALACGPGSKERCIGLADPNRPFEHLKSCQLLSKVEMVKQASYKSSSALDNIERANRATDEFRAACADMKAEPNKDENISKFPRAGKYLADEKKYAKTDSTQARDLLKQIREPLSVLEAPADCMKEIAEMQKSLLQKEAALNAREGEVAGCADIKIPEKPYNGPVWDKDPGGRTCGVAGCRQREDGKWINPALLNR